MATIAAGAAVAIKTVIGGALTGLGVGATTAYGIGSAVGTFVTSTGFLLSVAGGIAGALAPQVDAAGSPTEWKADPDAGIPFIVGRRAVAGNIVHRDEWGSDNRYQSIVTVYSGAGPINAYGTFTADGETCTFAGSYGRQSTGTWNDIFWRDTALGAQPDTALQSPADKGDPTIAGTLPAWNSSYKLSGKAASMLTMAMDKDRERWPNGEPQPLQLIEGILCWDPRLDSTYPGGSGSCRVDDASTWVYSENPYLHALKWCLGYFENDVLVGGIGAAQSGIDVPAFVEGANIADANDWVVSGQPTTKDDKHQVLLAMLQAGGGIYMRKGGKISCMVRTPRSSIVTVTGADTAGPFEIEIGADRLTRRNTIIPRCVMETHDWEMVAQDPVSEATYVTADGGTRESGVDYPYVAIKSNGTNRHQPAQLAAYDMVDSRETIRGTVPFKPHMAQIEPGDVFTIDEPGFLLDGVECLCMSRVFEPATNIVRIGFVSETSGKHTYALGLDPTPPTPPGLTAPDIYTVAAPGSGVWTPTADSGNTPGITVTGVADIETAAGIVVEYRTELDPADGLVWDDDDSGWQVVGEFKPSTTTIPIVGLESSTGYEVAISYISQYGVVGTRRISAVVTTGTMVADDATAPSTAISDAVTAINTAQGRADSTLAEAGQALAEAAETSLQDSLLNWIEDPTGSDGWLAADGGFIIGKTTGFKALWTPLAIGAQTTKVLWFPAEKNVAPGVLVQAGVEIAVEGAVSSVALEAVWFDSAGSVLSTDALDSGASGRLSGVEAAPASAASVRFRLVPTASSAADGVVAVSEPLAAFGRPDQVAADGYQDPTSEVVSRFVSIERSLGSMAGSVRQALTENRRARASITTTMATQVGQDNAIAAAKTELLTTVAGTYLSQASAATIYATISYTDNSISTLQTTLNASISDVSANVAVNAGAIANIEDGAAYFSVAVGASGGNPAIYEMLAGKDGSSISLGGDALYFFTTVGGTSIKAMEVVSGDVRISNDLYVDNSIIVSTSGAVMGGATGYLTGTGFFLGYDSAAYKLAVGNPSGQHLAWDGSTLAITGDITRAFGTSGALTIGDLGGGRTGFEILNSAGVEAFYADDTGAMRLNGDALPTTRAATAPSTPSPGHRWWDTVNEVESRWNGSTWDTWGSYGATWGDNVASIPTNLAALVGSEGILNTAVAIGADGALTGGGGGQVTISGLGYVGDLDATAGATWGNNVASIPTNLSTLVGSEGILNTAVSIAANGTLSGAGGGQVTLSGVGFTGDTNATYGAAWGSTVTGRPTELTDGRVAAGLDALGDLNRNISSARLDSSNALRRTGGGLFSGALNANYITNTNELTDGASLGTTAAWASISSRPAELTDGRITSALNASGILQTPIQNASQIPTLTLSKVSDAGTLAAKSTVAQAEISSGYSLIESGAGTPSPTSRRIYEDTTNDVIWYDDGTDIRRISREALTDNLGSNTGFSGAAYKVVVAIEVPGLKELDLLSIQTLQSNFQGPNEATDENVVGEWAIGIVDASRAPGDAWAGTGTENIIADGRTINFQLDGSDVVVNGNGIEGLILDVGGYRIPVAYEGTCYLCLLLRLTSFTSDQILLAGTGTQMRILISP